MYIIVHNEKIKQTGYLKIKKNKKKNNYFILGYMVPCSTTQVKKTFFHNLRYRAFFFQISNRIPNRNLSFFKAITHLW